MVACLTKYLTLRSGLLPPVAGTRLGASLSSALVRQGNRLDTTLLTAGLSCVIAAIIGGGLKAFGIDIPVLQSTKRQWALGVFGIALLSWSMFFPDTTSTTQQPNTKSTTGRTTTAIQPLRIDRKMLFSELQENRGHIERLETLIDELGHMYAQKEQVISSAERRIAHRNSNLAPQENEKQKSTQELASEALAILDDAARNTDDMKIIQEARSSINEGRRAESKGSEQIGYLKQRNNEIERLLAQE